MTGYDKDPQNPTDLLDQPIEIGDYVAYPTQASRSSRITVGRIDKITFKRRVQSSSYLPAWTECGRQVAEKYTVRVQPLVSTGYYWSGEDTGQPPRPVTIQNVENIVRLDAKHVEDRLGERNRQVKAQRDGQRHATGPGGF